MIATYRIESTLHIDSNYNCTFKTVDAVLPGLIRTMYAEDYCFEIVSIDDIKSMAIIKVYYEHEQRQNICQLFSVTAKEMHQHFNVVAIQGVL